VARVLFHIPLLEIGGSEVGLFELATRLPRDAFQPMIWCSERDGRIGAALREAGIPVYQRALQVDEAAASWVRELRPSIFHSLSYRRDPRDAAVAHLAGIPVVITVRNNMRHWDAEKKVQRWEGLRNELTTAVIANSRAAAEQCREIEAMPSEKVRVIPNGVRIPPFVARTPAGDVVRIGSVGNLRAVKGYDVLLRAAMRLVGLGRTFRLIIFGADYGELAALQRIRSDFGLEDCVTFAGPRYDPESIYNAMDIYVQSSNSEGMPRAILEAMARALPVVSTSAGGCGEAVVNGRTGILTEAGDAGGLADGLARLIDDEPLREQMGQAGRQRTIEHYDIDRLVRDHTDLYRSLLAIS